MRNTVSKYIEDVVGHQEPVEGVIFDPAVQREVRVAVVGPEGQFNVTRTGPNHKGSTICTVFWSEEQKRPMIPAMYSRIQADGLPAWVFFREGCQMKDTMDYYERWKKIDDAQQAARQRGDKLPRFKNVTPEDIYPKWVLARRKSHSHGREDIDLKAFLREHVNAEDVPEDGLDD